MGAGYFVNDIVADGKKYYKCILEHQATVENRPSSGAGGFWEQISGTPPIIFPADTYLYFPCALLIDFRGQAYGLPYYPDPVIENNSIVDYGMPTTDIDELVKLHAPKHYDSELKQPRYKLLIPDIRVPKNYAMDLELEAKGMLHNVLIGQYFENTKLLMAERFLEIIQIDYDDKDINLFDKFSILGKDYIAVEVYKDLSNDTSLITAREYYV